MAVQNSNARVAVRLAALVCALCSAIVLAGAAKTEPGQTSKALPRCAVWLREASFAASVEQHDADAFAAHLARGAVFINGRPPHLHGEAEVIEGWKGIVEGKGLVLRWHPDFVAIGGDGRTALSRGPFTMQHPDVNAPARFSIGTYQSVWVKDESGTWNVMFDGGGPPPTPATEDEVRALQKSWTNRCPFND